MKLFFVHICAGILVSGCSRIETDQTESTVDSPPPPPVSSASVEEPNSPDVVVATKNGGDKPDQGSRVQTNNDNDKEKPKLSKDDKKGKPIDSHVSLKPSKNPNGGGRKPPRGSPAENEVEVGASKKKIKIKGSFFTPGVNVGNYSWMIDRPEYARTLFVYNDNEEQFLAFHSGKLVSGCGVGGGNAAIRPKQCAKPPRAAGVPTGSNGQGYQKLTPHVRQLVKQAIAHIRQIVETNDIDTVLVSQARNTMMIGAGIFQIPNDVREYIFKSLLNLEAADD